MEVNKINNRVRHVNWLAPDDIRCAYERLYWKDFIATMGGWQISCRRISRILGKKAGQRYKRSWVYDARHCTR